MSRLINLPLYGCKNPYQTGVYLKDAYKEFVKQMVGKGYADKTIQTYNDHVIEFIKHLDDTNNEYVPLGLPRFPASHISNSLIIEWQGILRTRGNKDTTVKTKVKSIRTFLYWCMDKEREYCSTFNISLPQAEEAIKEVYSEEELDLILAQPQNNDLSEWRNWAAVNTIVRTGIRRASACELKWTDFDFPNKRALLRHSKNKKQQYIPLPKDLIEILLIWRDLSPVDEDGYVFFSTYKEAKLSPNSLTQAIRKYNLKRGVKKTSVHLMRHTYATTYLRKGGESAKLQKILGHQTSEMTQRYLHLVTDDLTEDIDDLTI